MEKKHECKKCKNDILLVKNIVEDCKERISIYLDCECAEDNYEIVMSFEDNSLMSAKDNFKGWLAQVSPYLIQNDYKIKDERSYEN